MAIAAWNDDHGTSPMAALEAVVDQSERIKEGGTSGALIDVAGLSPSFPLAVKEATSPSSGG